LLPVLLLLGVNVTILHHHHYGSFFFLLLLFSPYSSVLAKIKDHVITLLCLD
jgi:hypothetical protein